MATNNCFKLDKRGKDKDEEETVRRATVNASGRGPATGSV
jgi:hypothetical protein